LENGVEDIQLFGDQILAEDEDYSKKQWARKSKRKQNDIGTEKDTEAASTR